MPYCFVTCFPIKNTVHSFPSHLMYFNASPPLVASLCFIVQHCLDWTSFSQSLVVGHLGCSPFFTAANITVMNFLLPKSLHTSLIVSVE